MYIETPDHFIDNHSSGDKASTVTVNVPKSAVLLAVCYLCLQDI